MTSEWQPAGLPRLSGRRTFKYVLSLNLIMPRTKKNSVPQNPLFVGLAALVAILLITSASFDTPLISFSGAGGETASLGFFSALGVPLIGLLVIIVVLVRVKK